MVVKFFDDLNKRFFQNPEHKLKTLASLVFILLSVSGLLFGLMQLWTMASMAEYMGAGIVFVGLIVAVVIILIFLVVGFLSGLSLAAYASFLENVKRMADSNEMQAEAVCMLAKMENRTSAADDSTEN